MNVILFDRFKVKLNALLKANGLSQSELARRMGIRQSVVSRYCLGQTCPGLDVVEKFANALDVPPESLIDESEILQPTACTTANLR